MRRKVELAIACTCGAILVISVAFAGQTGQQGRGGTAADFAMMFPWVVVALVVALFAVIAWFLKRYDEAREKKIDQVIDEIGKTNRSLAAATNKLDATINTLFERDRDIERVMSDHGAAIAAIQATCAARGRMCPLFGRGEQMVCLDRRDGEERREEK